MKKLILSSIAIVCLSGCFAQDPAMIVDKKNHFYGSEIATKKQKMVLTAPIDSSYKFDNSVEVASLPKLEKAPAKKVGAMVAPEELSPTKRAKTQSKKYADGFNNADLTEKKTSNINRVAEVVDDGAFKLNSPLNRKGFAWPVKGKITSRYGKKGNKFNEGINIAAPAGTIVSSAASGKVIYIGKKIEGYGNLIIVKHKEDGIMTAYAHLQDILVSKGSEVSRGEGIATIGETGSVKNPQLHFSVRKGKKTIDPEKTA